MLFQPMRFIYRSRGDPDLTRKEFYRRGRKRLGVLLSALSLIVVGANAADLILDLTGQQPADDHLPVVGSVITGTSDGGPMTKPVKLPLEVSMQDISPLSPSVTKDEMYLQLLVRNVGKEPIAIPSSKHYSEVMKSGNADRRVMGLALTFAVEAANGVSKGPIREYLAVAVGSSSVPGSLLVINPGKSVLILARGRLWRTQEWDKLGSGAFSTTVRAVLDEQFVDDDRLYQKNFSEDAVSTNAVHLTVWWRP